MASVYFFLNTHHTRIFLYIDIYMLLCISKIDISLQIPHEYASAVSAIQTALPAALCKSLQLVQAWY